LVWSFRSGWTAAPIALLQLVAFSDPIAKTPNGPEINDANGNPRRSEIMSAPATYVIDQTGLVALAFVDVECRSLMDHGQILRALECLAGRNKS
jgi:hypothetical protein